MQALLSVALGLIATAPPELAPPLSPESLSPPPSAEPVARAATFDKPHVSCHYTQIKGSIDDCLARSMTAVAAQKNVKYFEIADGKFAWGYTSNCRIVVMVSRFNDECSMAWVVTSGWHEHEFLIQDLSASIRDRMITAAAPKDGATRFGTRDRRVEEKIPALVARVDVRQSNALSRHFASVACVLMEKYGYKLGTLRPGTDMNSMASGNKSSDREFIMFTMLPMADNREVAFVSIGAGQAVGAVAKDVRTVSTAVMKLLYE